MRDAYSGAAIEHIEAEAWAQLHLGLSAGLRAQLRCEVKRHGRAVSVVTPGADVPTANRTIGLGLESDLTDDQLAEIQALYTSAGVPRWLIEWSPAARPHDGEIFFARHGGRPMTPTVKLWRTLESMVSSTRVSELQVLEIGPADTATFEGIVADSLGVPEIMAPVVRATIGVPHWHFYLAVDGGRPIAGAAMFIEGDGAWFGLSATRPTHRGRGAQTALLARRLQDAAAARCVWVTADTQPDTEARPNPSYRNMRRAGFEVAYDRAKYLFQHPHEAANSA
ncbi:MAG: GNAT family N-acetyltransferase [Gemmatimonadaceae bacterium]